MKSTNQPVLGSSPKEEKLPAATPTPGGFTTPVSAVPRFVRLAPWAVHALASSSASSRPGDATDVAGAATRRLLRRLKATPVPYAPFVSRPNDVASNVLMTEQGSGGDSTPRGDKGEEGPRDGASVCWEVPDRAAPLHALLKAWPADLPEPSQAAMKSLASVPLPLPQRLDGASGGAVSQGVFPFRRPPLVGMDAASVLSVIALAPRRHERVLDLCCAPGMKLLLLRDALDRGGLAVGVDVSLPRALDCRAAVLMANADDADNAAAAEKTTKEAGVGQVSGDQAPGRVRLYVGDGRTFHLDASVARDFREQESVGANGLAAAGATPAAPPQAPSGLACPFTQPARIARHMKYLLQRLRRRPRDDDVVTARGDVTPDPAGEVVSPQAAPQPCGVAAATATVPAATLSTATITAAAAAKHGDRGRTTGGAPTEAVSEGTLASGVVLYEDEGCPAFAGRFDRVLVDAECTHDGAVAHVGKMDRANFGQLVAPPPACAAAVACAPSAAPAAPAMTQAVNLPSPHPVGEEGGSASMAALCDLQHALLLNAFRNVHCGGVVVYSTCSLTQAQNEGVVRRFLDGVNTASTDSTQPRRGPRAILVDPFSEAAGHVTTTDYDLTAHTSASASAASSTSVESDISPLLRLRPDQAALLRERVCITSKVLPPCVLCHPDVARTSAQFIAKIVRLW